jgi:hypothetical protein
MHMLLEDGDSVSPWPDIPRGLLMTQSVPLLGFIIIPDPLTQPHSNKNPVKKSRMYHTFTRKIEYELNG